MITIPEKEKLPMEGTRQQHRAAHVYDPLFEDFETFITFDRPLPCVICDALTQWGHVQRDGEQFTLGIYCPGHGFARRTYYLGAYGTGTPLETQEQEESVARFVVAMHDGQGSATVLAAVHPELAPGYHVWQPDDFATEEEYQEWREVYPPQAWSVRYVAQADADPVYFIVIYDEEFTQFHLCAQDGSCRPPQHLSEDEPV